MSVAVKCICIGNPLLHHHVHCWKHAAVKSMCTMAIMFKRNVILCLSFEYLPSHHVDFLLAPLVKLTEIELVAE